MIYASEKDIERFWSKVEVGQHEMCWNWLACRTGAKALGWYGRFAIGARRFYAHRVAFCVSRGYPVDYLTDQVAIMHTCDNPICCNPSHLELGTQLHNIQDMIRKNRNRGRRRKEYA